MIGSLGSCAHRIEEGSKKVPLRNVPVPTEEISNSSLEKENSPRKREKFLRKNETILRKNEMILRKNEMILRKNLRFPPWIFFISSGGNGRYWKVGKKVEDSSLL